MRNTKTCPKCQGTEIVRIPGWLGPLGIGPYANLINISWFRGIEVTRYLCASCGFTEEWVEGERNLELLREEYPRHK